MKLTVYQRFMRSMARLIFPKAKTSFEVVPDGEPAVFVCNHSGAVGPMLMSLYFEIPHKTWIINYVLDRSKNANFIFHDFMCGRGKKHKKFWRGLSKITAKLLRPLLDISDPIPVYHDRRVIDTFRESSDALASGESIVLFAECPTKYSEYVNSLYAGFPDLGRSYFTATGKSVKFYPVYCNKENKIISVGAPVEYDTSKSAREERDRIAEEMRNGIDALARALPKHKPVPFLTDEWYKYYGEYESDPMAYWHTFD